MSSTPTPEGYKEYLSQIEELGIGVIWVVFCFLFFQFFRWCTAPKQLAIDEVDEDPGMPELLLEETDE